MDWILLVPWWVWLIIHIICCGVGYGIFHNVETESIIAIDRVFLLFGIMAMFALILCILCVLAWEVIKLPYRLGIFLRDKLGFEIRN